MTAAGAGAAGPRVPPRLAAAAISLATLLVVVATSLVLLFNPAWVGFEQERARADLWTGWTPAEVRQVTEAIVAEVYLGPGDFAQEIRGRPVLDERERGHMADVRTVWLAFLLVAGLATALLVVAWARSSDRGRFWRAVAAGAAVLAAGTVVVGVGFVLLFDAAFELLHRLLFATGTYTFDPQTEHLVQLFPYAFWTETTVAIAALILVLAAGTWAAARWRVHRTEGAR